MHQFPKFTPASNSTCFRQFLCPSSGVYSLYTRHWYMSDRFVDSFRAVPFWSCSKAVFKTVWHIPVPSLQRINSWRWAEELPETCRVWCRSKFGKLVYLIGFIIKKFVTMHGHMNVKFVQNFSGIYVQTWRVNRAHWNESLIKYRWETERFHRYGIFILLWPVSSVHRTISRLYRATGFCRTFRCFRFFVFHDIKFIWNETVFRFSFFSSYKVL